VESNGVATSMPASCGHEKIIQFFICSVRCGRKVRWSDAAGCGGILLMVVAQSGIQFH
jgi:hypothetical protein